MGRFKNPFGSSTGSSPDVTQIAEENNVKQNKPFTFSSLVDTINAPSKMTEDFLTGNQGYEKSGLGTVGSFAARMALDPLNLVGPLKLGGLALKGAGVAGKLATKIKPIGKAAEWAGDAFIPQHKLSKVSTQLADELPALKTRVGAKQNQAVRDVGKTFKDTPQDIRGNLGKILEKRNAGEVLSTDEQGAVDKASQFISERITQPEKEAGVLKKEVEAYFPRVAERKETERLMKALNPPGLPTTLGGAEKARKYATQAEGEANNVVYKDAMEALAIRASKSVAARENSAFLGRLFSGEIKDNAGGALMSPMKKADELIEGNVAVRVDKSGMRVGDKFLGFYPLKTEAGKKAVGVTTRGANFQVPAEAADELTKYYNTFTSDDATNGLLKGYDKLLGAWKASVTTLFPAYHERNEIGNLSNMWLGGFFNPLNPLSVAKGVKHFADAGAIQAGKAIKVKGTEVTKDMLEQLGVVGRGQYTEDIPKILGSTLDKPGIASKLNPLKAPANVLEGTRVIGGTLEDNAKIAFFLHQLDKGRDVKTAVAQVRKYLFDYSNLTPFEKNVMKRTIPFYTWMRNNIPLQVETLIKSPGKTAAITKSFQNLLPMSEEQKGALPSWFQDTMAGTMPGSENSNGDFQTVSNIGLPVEDLGRLFRDTPGNNLDDAIRTFEKEGLGSTGPLGNLLGIAMKRDIFRGKSYDDPSLAYTYGKEAKGYPKFVQDLLDFKEETSKKGNTSYRVDPRKFQILKAFLGRGARVVSKPDSAYIPGTITDMNVADDTQRKQDTQQRELEKILVEKGIMKNFTKAYVPAGGSSGRFKSPF